MSTVETHLTERDYDGATQVIVEFELPDAVVEEVREKHGDLDPDEISDRIVPVPTVDGEQV